VERVCAAGIGRPGATVPGRARSMHPGPAAFFYEHGSCLPARDVDGPVGGRLYARPRRARGPMVGNGHAGDRAHDVHPDRDARALR